MRRAALLTALALLALAPAAGATLVYNRGAMNVKPTLWAAADDGSGAHRIASNAFAAHLSPDGRLVAYQTFDGSSLMLVPSAGGSRKLLLRPLRDSDVFAWSPDSKTVAAVTGSELGRKRLVLIDVASGTARTVSRGYFDGVSFSPTGGAIVYSRATSDDHYPPRSSLWVAPVGDGAPVRITHGHSDMQPLWGPDMVVFSRARRARKKYDAPKQDLYVLAPDGSAARRLTCLRPAFLMYGLSAVAWSGDGAHLLANFGGQDTGYVQTVDPSTGKTLVPVKPSLDIIGDALSRDGSTILGTRGFPEDYGKHSDVVTVPYDGGTPTVLVRHAYLPDWNR